MYGRTEYFLILVCVTAAIATITDLVRGRIYNWLTLPALLVGLGCSLAFGGWNALGDALLGAFAGIFFYGWMFRIGVMGGGDVKLLMAFGAMGGLRYVSEVAILGVILGGILALFILIAKGRIVDFFKKVYRFIFTIAVKELEIEVPQVDRKLTMPFGLSISAAAVWSAFAHPLERWGIFLWK